MPSKVLRATVNHASVWFHYQLNPIFEHRDANLKLALARFIESWIQTEAHAGCIRGRNPSLRKT
jgi:hypothetical protein